MAKKTKTFKIGEYCKGGIITAEVTDKQVTVIGKEWDYSKGSNKGSDQSNAKEFDRCTVNIDNPNGAREISNFLNDLTTSYYSEQVMDWLEANSKFQKSRFW